MHENLWQRVKRYKKWNWLELPLQIKIMSGRNKYFFEDPIDNGFCYKIEHFVYFLDEKESDINSLEKIRNYYGAVSKIIENNKQGSGE